SVWAAIGFEQHVPPGTLTWRLGCGGGFQFASAHGRAWRSIACGRRRRIKAHVLQKAFARGVFRVVDQCAVPRELECGPPDESQNWPEFGREHDAEGQGQRGAK